MRSLAAFLALALLVVPANAGAQPAQVVEKCSRECDPKEVNGAAYKTGDDPVTVLLYGHFEDILNMAPLNTQAPTREPDLNRGYIMPVIDTNSGACVPSTQMCADFHFRNNEFTMFSSPGLVEYLEDGWRTHQEPFINYDIPLLGDELTLYWYMSPGLESMRGGATTLPPESTAVGVMPFVDVYARMETGRFKFQGDLIAETPFDPRDLDSRTTMISLPGQDNVYEFQVKMKVVKESIDGAAPGFIVYVSPYQLSTDKEKGTQAATPHWRVRSGADFPIRVLLPTKEPLKTFGANALIRDGNLLIGWQFGAALGNYDRLDEKLELTLRGNHSIPSSAITTLVRGDGYDHHGFQPVNVTWLVDLDQVSLPDGPYELEASVPNLQDTYLLRHVQPFEVRNGQVVIPNMAAFEGEASPMAPLGLLLVAILLVAFRRRA